MSTFAPTAALTLLQQKGLINYERAQSLIADTPSIVLNEAMEVIERSEAFQVALSGLLDEIGERVRVLEVEEGALKVDPRYASAPEVCGVFVRQVWDDGDVLVEVGRDEFVVPLSFLVARRDDLGSLVDSVDSDWLAYDLGLMGGHEGPFEVVVEEELVVEWLRVTA